MGLVEHTLAAVYLGCAAWAWQYLLQPGELLAPLGRAFNRKLAGTDYPPDPDSLVGMRYAVHKYLTCPVCLSGASALLTTLAALPFGHPFYTVLYCPPLAMAVAHILSAHE